MITIKHLFVLGMVVAANLAFLGSMASAGAKLSKPVVVDTAGRHVYGSSGTARNSTDSFQEIHCWLSTTTGVTYGGCGARSSANVSATCSTQDPDLLDAIKTVNSNSLIEFYYDASGACLAVRVTNGSQNEIAR